MQNMTQIKAYGSYLSKKGDIKPWKFTFYLEENETAILREVRRLAKDKLTRTQMDFQHVLTQAFTEFGKHKKRRVVHNIENLFALSKPRLLELAEDEFGLKKEDMLKLTTKQIIGLMNEELDAELAREAQDPEMPVEVPDTLGEELADQIDASDGIDGPSEKALLNAEALRDIPETSAVEDDEDPIEPDPEVETQIAQMKKKTKKKTKKKVAKKKKTKKKTRRSASEAGFEI